MSLCKICSEQLYRDADILCKKHTEEFVKMKARIDAGEDPPFGLIKEAWTKEAFGEIGDIIESAHMFSGPPEEKIKKVVEEYNRNARSLMRDQQATSDRKAKQRELAKTLGITL